MQVNFKTRKNRKKIKGDIDALRGFKFSCFCNRLQFGRYLVTKTFMGKNLRTQEQLLLYTEKSLHKKHVSNFLAIDFLRRKRWSFEILLFHPARLHAEMKVFPSLKCSTFIFSLVWLAISRASTAQKMTLIEINKKKITFWWTWRICIRKLTNHPVSNYFFVFFFFLPVYVKFLAQTQ